MVLNVTDVREPASRKFTDRDEPRSLFERALREQPADRSHVIVWYGVGGQGKTALCDHLRRFAATAHREGPLALGALDFETIPAHRHPVEALLHLRLSLAAEQPIKFPTFDIAFAQFFALACPGEDIRQRYPRLFRNRESEVLSDLIEVAEDATDVLGAKVLFKYGTLLVGWLHDWWTTPDVKEEVNRIQNMSASKLLEQLPVFFGADVRRALATEQPPRIVVMLDAYEKLWLDTPRGALENLRVDSWVRTLVEQTPGALFLIFCRDKLRWTESSPRWNDLLEQHLLGGLSDEDAGRFLDHAGIRDAAVRDRIVKAANGLPFYLDLALDLHEHIEDREHRKPLPDDFGTTHHEVLDRFRDHLSDAEVEDLELASYPDLVDERLLGDMSRALRSRMVDWARLAHRSYMTRLDDGTLRMHALMREACQAQDQRLRPQFHADAHRFLFNHFDQRIHALEHPRQITDEHEASFLAAARHRITAGEPAPVAWLLTHQELFANGGRWVTLDRAFELFDEARGPFPAGGRDGDGVWFYHHHANVLQHMGLLSAALELYQRARDNYPPSDTADPEYATILDAMANISWELGDRRGAEPLYAAARAIYQAAPERYPIRLAYALLKLGTCRHAEAQATEGEALYQEAQQRFEPLAGTHPREFAGFLLDLARIRRGQGRVDDAVALLERALQIYSSPEGEAEGCVTVLLDLAACAIDRQDYTTAGNHLERAVADHRHVFGREHPNTGRALHLQADLWLLTNPLHPDAASQLADAVSILTESLGDEHPWTLEACAARDGAPPAWSAPV